MVVPHEPEEIVTRFAVLMVTATESWLNPDGGADILAEEAASWETLEGEIIQAIRGQLARFGWIYGLRIEWAEWDEPSQ